MVSFFVTLLLNQRRKLLMRQQSANLDVSLAALAASLRRPPTVDHCSEFKLWAEIESWPTDIGKCKVVAGGRSDDEKLLLLFVYSG